MRPSSSAYDRDTGNFGWSVTYVDGRGWRVLGLDGNEVTVVAEPGVYYESREEAEEAMEILRDNI